jgi:hypothetical protein
MKKGKKKSHETVSLRGSLVIDEHLESHGMGEHLYECHGMGEHLFTRQFSSRRAYRNFYGRLDTDGTHISTKNQMSWKRK